MNIKKPTLNIIDRKELSFDKKKRTLDDGKFTDVEDNFPGECSITKSVHAKLNLHITVLNSEGIILSVNKKFDKTPNLDGPLHISDSYLGLDYFKVCEDAVKSANDDVKVILNKISSVFSNQTTNVNLDYSCACLGGERWFLSNVFRDAEDATKIIITHQNISKEKGESGISGSGSRKLDNTLSELGKILDSSLDVICTINSAGILVTFNKASQELLGYSPEELIDTNFIQFVYEEDRISTDKVFQKITKGVHIPIFENRCLHKNGNLIPFLWSINYDDARKLLYCVGKDVTDRKLLEKAIADERDQFYEMFQKAPSAIGMLKGPNHVFEMANPLYLKLIGKKNILGKTVAEVLPEVIEQGFVEILDQVYRSGEPYIGREVLVKVNDGRKKNLSDHYINFVYQAYRNNSGVIVGIFFFINDVTIQVESKKIIERSEKKYLQILETAQEGIWVLDEKSRTTFVNKKICDILGYTTQEMMGNKNTYFMDKHSKKKALVAFARRKKGVAQNLELTFVSKKGEDILTTVSANPIFDEENYKGFLCMVSNITEKRRLENLLDKSNRLARIGSWEIDVVSGTVFWSDITKEIREAEADFNPHLEIGIDFFKEGQDKLIISDRVQDCIAFGTPWDEELKIVTFKGNLKWIRTIGEAVMINGKCSKIYGSFQDITESKNAVEKVLRSETRLKIAQLIARVGSWELNIATNIHSWSDEFFRILQMDESIVPSYDAFLPLIHPDDRQYAASKMQDAFIKLEDSSFQFRFTRRDGELGYASSEWRFEFDRKGNPLYIYGILRDLTAEKKLETERVKMMLDITQRNKDLEQFSYIISHNLRAPVANIVGLTEELKDESHSSEAKLMLGDALTADVRRLENVIADLNIILQTKREITERKEDVNLSELVDNIKHSINDLIHKKGVHIITDFKAIDDIKIIKSYIHSIFYNLISNSIKYRLAACDLIINIKSHISDGALTLVFEDNGRGMDLNGKADQIFGLYKRFHADTEGKGMGLYMVKTQVESLGGKISVVSEIDMGSTFTIVFEYNS